MENPGKMDVFGVPPFKETPIFGPILSSSKPALPGRQTGKLAWALERSRDPVAEKWYGKQVYLHTKG